MLSSCLPTILASGLAEAAAAAWHSLLHGDVWVRRQANKAMWYTGQRDVDLTSIVDPVAESR